MAVRSSSLEQGYRVEMPMRPLARLDGPNARLHWHAKSKRRKVWGTAFVIAMPADWPRELPNNGVGWRVTFAVSARRGTVDSDNRYGMLKALRDVVARSLGCDDKPGGIDWSYPEWTRGPDGTVVALEQIGDQG